MLKRKNIIKIAIDSPAAAGAGTQAKLISKHYNLLQLDTGRIYRYIANIKIREPKKFNYQYLKKKINICLLYTSPSPRDLRLSRMPSSA